MKKFLFIFVLFLGVFSLAQAQRDTSQRPSSTGDRPQRMDPAERVERQTQHLKETLSLTDEQTAKVKGIYTKNMEKQRQAFEKARESGKEVDREEMRTQMMTSMKQQDTEVKALLTDEQKVKYEEFIKEREERMKNWQGGSGRRGN